MSNEDPAEITNCPNCNAKIEEPLTAEEVSMGRTLSCHACGYSFNPWHSTTLQPTFYHW